jgi:hypothetical protein
VNADLRPLFLLADFVSQFVHADITLETVTLDAPNNVAAFVTDVLAKRPHMMSSLKIGQVSNFPIIAHGLSLITIINALT